LRADDDLRAAMEDEKAEGPGGGRRCRPQKLDPGLAHGLGRANELEAVRSVQ
jgi:hypothetical protein